MKPHSKEMIPTHTGTHPTCIDTHTYMHGHTRPACTCSHTCPPPHTHTYTHIYVASSRLGFIEDRHFQQWMLTSLLEDKHSFKRCETRNSFSAHDRDQNLFPPARHTMPKESDCIARTKRKGSFPVTLPMDSISWSLRHWTLLCSHQCWHPCFIKEG